MISLAKKVNASKGTDAAKAEGATSQEAVRETEDHVRSCFRSSPYLDLRHIDCRMEDGVLSMHGRVGSFYLKQIAQTVASKVEGVRRIENHLEVKSF